MRQTDSTFVRSRELTQKEVRKITTEEINQTMQLINKKIQNKCKQQGDSAKEIYLLSMALKEMNQLEPSEMK